MNLKSKTNESLVADLKEMVAKERHLLTQILHCLREVESRRLYLEKGYPSLFAFMREVLGYSEGAAQRRIQAMRLVKDIPQVEEKLESGKLSLSVAAQIQGFIRKDNQNISQSEKLELIEQLEGTSARECEKKLIALSPETSLPKEKTKIITEEKTLIQFVADKELMKDIEKLKSLMAHQNYEGRYDQLFKKTVKMALEQLDPERREVRRKAKSVQIRVKKNLLESSKSSNKFFSPKRQSTPTSAVGTRHIPQNIRDQIWIRDQGRCQYRDSATGKACDSKHALQIDHITPYALGGNHTPENLRLLCNGHNQHRAREMFG